MRACITRECTRGAGALFRSDENSIEKDIPSLNRLAKPPSQHQNTAEQHEATKKIQARHAAEDHYPISALRGPNR